VPVATLLKRLLDQTHYRTALQSAEGGARARRNVDKLLADAHTSGLVSVREFVEYVRTLRDVGARESEAPTEAGSAVQLMTVHKSKGLEFPVVVIADAAHAGRQGVDRVLLDDKLGVTMDLHDEENRRPAAHLLAGLRNVERDEAEDRRLLYVAATRAREKLLVSAHTKILKGGALQMTGWLGRLGRVAGLDEVAMAGTPLEPLKLSLPGRSVSALDIGCWIYPWCEERLSLANTQPTRSAPGDLRRDLVAPLVLTFASDVDGKLEAYEAQPPRRVWRVLPRTRRVSAPAWVVGTLVHAALRRWRFEEDDLKGLLRPLVLQMGVVDPDLVHASIQTAMRILRRFRADPLWKELDAAQRWHELPFSIIVEGTPGHTRVENGVIDLLCRVGDRYKIVEFKTDRQRSEDGLRTHIREKGYDEQVQRYRHAVRSQLGVEAEAMWVFLNVGNRVMVVPASW
ncbi:MAG: PD-(D/E)XK nuclease family protein, partial [Anaerolineae bacterium]|nr:PD-(D/E)XK nuclease family protein [Anaerolineae bacterium]